MPSASKYLDETRAQELIDETKRRLALKVDKSSSPYTPGGSIPFASLPAATEAVSGMVYNITTDFVTTADFIEGAGIKCAAGTDVAVVKIPNTNPVQYKYNIYSGNAEPEILTAAELAYMWKDPGNVTIDRYGVALESGSLLETSVGSTAITITVDNLTGNVTITSSDTSIATIDNIQDVIVVGADIPIPPKTFQITPVAAGIATVTISVAESATNKAVTKTLEVSVS